jgi:hypothetical protein
MCRPRWISVFAASLLAQWAVLSVLARAQAPRPEVAAGEQTSAEVAAWIRQLDSDSYSARQQAASRLERLAAEPAKGLALAREVERALVAPDTSLEVRRQLERVRRRLPKVTLAPETPVAAEELDQLVRQLDDDSYGARLAAAKRLDWLLGNEKLAYPIMVRLKRQMEAAGLSAGARQSLEPIYQRVRGAWLASDPAAWNLPPVSDAQLARWLDDLVRAEGASPRGDAPPARQTAMRELGDLLARDNEVTRIKQAIEARLADQGLTPQGAAPLRELLELTRPGMVAEYWEGRRHLSTQHLLVGVPSWSPGAERPSHFDRIDDQVAHCASGQNLSPGDYPVAVAIPHPKNDGALFHLVNLSTPRRRMAYAHQSQTDEAARLAQLSRRTLDRLLARRSALDERELALLEQLDPAEVSRFAGRFFQLVEDQPLPAEGSNGTWLRPSRHGAICVLLAMEGTREAVPGLLRAIEANRFLPPTAVSPHRLPWLAALSIAQRDPWPEVDAWLSGLIVRTDALVHGAAHAPELGATAAGILLGRRQQEPSKFGLETVPDETLADFNLSGCRFASPEARQKVQQWWDECKRRT